MKTPAKIFGLAIAVVTASFSLPAQQTATAPAHKWTIVVHGGAGVIERPALGPEGDAAYRAALTTATEAGAKVLDRGGSALDAVETVLNILEDDPLFNAGHGAVFTAEGKTSWTPRSWTAQLSKPAQWLE